MTTGESSASTEPRWRTYFRAAAFSLPALVIWALCCVFVLPKLQQIWRDAGFTAAPAQTAMQTSFFLIHHGVIISIAVATGLVLLEWRSRHWPRYRAVFVGIAAFLVNTAILVFITAMFITAMLSR